MYNSWNYNFGRVGFSYSGANTGEGFKRCLNSFNDKFSVGNFLVVENVLGWHDGEYEETYLKKWTAMFVAQIVEFSPVEGTMNIFTEKKRITKLPRIVVKAPDGTRFEPFVFTDTGKEIEGFATDATVKCLLENTCVGKLDVEDFSLYGTNIYMCALSRREALYRFTKFNEQKEETAEKMKSEYASRKLKQEQEEQQRKQQEEEQRKKAENEAKSRKMFEEMFGD